MKELATISFQIINSYESCLVDFYSTVCGSCKTLKKTLEHKDLSNINIFGVNIDHNSDLAIKFHIMSVPTLLLFKNGKVQDQLIGKLTLSNIKKFIRM